MNNTGFLMLHLDNHETSQVIINSLKKIIESDPYNNYVLFASSVNCSIPLSVPVLHIDHAKYFDGNIWCFDINGLQLHAAFQKSNMIYYASDVPWLFNYMNYEKWDSLFNNDKIKIVANNQQIYDVYEICWKKPEGIIEELNYEKVQQFI